MEILIKSHLSLDKILPSISHFQFVRSHSRVTAWTYLLLGKEDQPERREHDCRYLLLNANTHLSTPVTPGPQVILSTFIFSRYPQYPHWWPILISHPFIWPQIFFSTPPWPWKKHAILIPPLTSSSMRVSPHYLLVFTSPLTWSCRDGKKLTVTLRNYSSLSATPCWQHLSAYLHCTLRIRHFSMTFLSPRISHFCHILSHLSWSHLSWSPDPIREWC